MKKILITLTVLATLIIVVISCATQQVIITYTLNKMFFIENEDGTMNEGWIIGNHGLLYNTKNSGLTWNLKDLNTDVELTDIYFTDKETGYLVGERGLLVKTEDGGNTFNRYDDFLFNGYFNDIDFYNKDLGIIAGDGGALYITRDGGESWIDIKFLTEEHIRSVIFVDENELWMSTIYGRTFEGEVSDYSMFWKSTDQGFSWAEMINRNDAQFLGAYPYDMKIKDDYLYISAAAQIVRVNLLESSPLISMDIFDIFNTIIRYPEEKAMRFKALTFRNDEVWSAGLYAENRGAVYYSNNNGLNWDLKFTSDKGYINSEENLPSSDNFIEISDIKYVRNGINSMFIAVGGTGAKIITSTDGDLWDLRFLN